jgi:hypothetical protein
VIGLVIEVSSFLKDTVIDTVIELSRVGVSLPLPEDRNRSSSKMLCFLVI